MKHVSEKCCQTAGKTLAQASLDCMYVNVKPWPLAMCYVGFLPLSCQSFWSCIIITMTHVSEKRCETAGKTLAQASLDCMSMTVKPWPLAMCYVGFLPLSCQSSWSYIFVTMIHVSEKCCQTAGIAIAHASRARHMLTPSLHVRWQGRHLHVPCSVVQLVILKSECVTK